MFIKGRRILGGSLGGILRFALLGPRYVWLRSHTWAWYSGLFLGGVAISSMNEFALTALLFMVSAVSLLAQLWHWSRNFPSRVLVPFRLFGSVVMLLLLMCFLGIVNVFRAGRPWSQLPEAIAQAKAVLLPQELDVKDMRARSYQDADWKYASELMKFRSEDIPLLRKEAERIKSSYEKEHRSSTQDQNVEGINRALSASGIPWEIVHVVKITRPAPQLPPVFDIRNSDNNDFSNNTVVNPGNRTIVNMKNSHKNSFKGLSVRSVDPKQR